MVATTLTAVAEAAKDCRMLIWNVRNMCETSGWFWICEGMVIAILTVLSGGPFANPISDDSSRQKETDENAAWRRPMKNELKHHERGVQIRTLRGTLLRLVWIAGMRSARIVWTAARSILSVRKLGRVS